MKNNNGFTLVELLATIAILGVLMMVAVPTVSIYINKSKVDSFIYTAREYQKSAKNLYLLDRIQCNGLSAFESGNGVYSISFSSNPATSTSYNNYKKLIKEGGNSPFGDSYIYGAIYIQKTGDAEDETLTWYIQLRDGELNGIKDGNKSYVEISKLNASKIVRNSAPTAGYGGTKVECNIN